MASDAMLVDFPGKIRNTTLPFSNCLLPLFEAVINSIHAIEDRQKEQKEGGKIEIHIDRDNTPQLPGMPQVMPEIIGFTVIDDGIGFTDRNYRSFLTSDSTYKKDRGGKGLGRMLWLKAFARAEIESQFVENGKHFHRKFGFTCSQKGVEKSKKSDSTNTTQKTSVSLVSINKRYREAMPKTTAPIARRIIEHCLEFFVLKTAPSIVLKDGSDIIDLNAQFANDIHIRSEPKDFTINGKPFHILHVMVKATADSDHVLHFCADSRSVRSLPGGKHIPNIETPLQANGQPFVYAGYLSGEYLDDRAINERTQFAIYETEDVGMYSDQEIVWGELVGACAKQASDYLEPYTAPVKAKKMERIRKFVMEEAAQYRPLLKHKVDRLDSIPANIADDRLDLELYKIDQEYDIELRERCRELLAKGDKKAVKHEDYRKELEKFTEEWNEHGMGKLARHVAYRKATLRFLNDRIKLQGSGKYSLESTMHEVIFPLKKTSDDLRSDQMNLWVLDEKLAYHFYLASDLPFSEMDAITVDSEKRPDILVFDKPFAFAETDDKFRSIVIVEFKRPERDDYRDGDAEKNPIIQVMDYVKKIKAGKATDRHGNTIYVADSTPFYAYVVCDITESLKRQADISQLTITPDQDGYFGFHKAGFFIEIISFKKLLGDARRRNERLFDELGIGRSCT